jgi:hypothetical protein
MLESPSFDNSGMPEQNVQGILEMKETILYNDNTISHLYFYTFSTLMKGKVNSMVECKAQEEKCWVIQAPWVYCRKAFSASLFV